MPAKKGQVCGNHDRAAAGRKGKARSPWRRDVVRSPNSRKLREQWATKLPITPESRGTT